MTLLDRSNIGNPLRWWPVAYTAGYLTGYARGKERGRAEGQLSAWCEVNEAIVDHGTRYDPVRVSAREERRRRGVRGVE